MRHGAFIAFGGSDSRAGGVEGRHLCLGRRGGSQGRGGDSQGRDCDCRAEGGGQLAAAGEGPGEALGEGEHRARQQREEAWYDEYTGRKGDIRALFDKLDVGGDGLVTREELQEVFDGFGSFFGFSAEAPPSGLAAGRLSPELAEYVAE